MSNADLALARSLVRQAGAIVLDRTFQHQSASTKKDQTNNLLTETDMRVEKALIEAIAGAHPDDDILGEETGTSAGPAGQVASRSNRRWIIDPIDGTTNFAHGMPFFVISVGLEVDGVPSVGVVGAPALGWTFWAAVGEGASWSRVRPGSSEEIIAPLRVSAVDRLDAALLATGFPYDLNSNPRNNFVQFERLYRASQGIRRVGAAALDLAMVAAGWFDGYWEMRLKPWDAAAGRLLVTEAGGRVTNFTGDRFDLAVGDIIASNGRIHGAIVDALDERS